MLERTLKISLMSLVLILMTILTWNVLNDKKVRDKMHANSLIGDQVGNFATRTAEVSKGIFTTTKEVEARIVTPLAATKIVKKKIVPRRTVANKKKSDQKKKTKIPVAKAENVKSKG